MTAVAQKMSGLVQVMTYRKGKQQELAGIQVQWITSFVFW
jgi:hypothetical protein